MGLQRGRVLAQQNCTYVAGREDAAGERRRRGKCMGATAWMMEEFLWATDPPTGRGGMGKER